MKKITTTILCLTLIFSCSSKKNGNDDLSDYDHVRQTEYSNHYNNGNLTKKVATVSEWIKGVNFPTSKTIYEYSYTYQSDGTVRKDEYKIEDLGYRTLQYTTNTSAFREEWIEWKGGDTVNYQLREYGHNKRLVHQIRRMNLSVPAYDFVVAENFEEWSVVDTCGRIVEQKIKEFRTGDIRTTRYFYNAKPTIVPTAHLKTVWYQDTLSGDTTIEKMYSNGELENIHKKYDENSERWSLYFNKNHQLIYSSETLYQGNDSIEISIDKESQSTDSAFYHNGMEFKTVSITPDSKVLVIFEYDNLKNLTKETRYTKFNE